MSKRAAHRIRATIEVGAKIPEDDSPVIPDIGTAKIKILKGTKVVYEKDFNISHKNYDIFDTLGADLIDLLESLEKREDGDHERNS
jgi:hypothetical protein